MTGFTFYSCPNCQHCLMELTLLVHRWRDDLTAKLADMEAQRDQWQIEFARIEAKWLERRQALAVCDACCKERIRERDEARKALWLALPFMDIDIRAGLLEKHSWLRDETPQKPEEEGGAPTDNL